VRAAGARYTAHAQGQRSRQWDLRPVTPIIARRRGTSGQVSDEFIGLTEAV